MRQRLAATEGPSHCDASPFQPRYVAWANESEVLKFLAFLKKYNPDANPNDSLNVIAYVHAATVVAVLRLCGDDLTRKNLLYEATQCEPFAFLCCCRAAQ